MTDVRRALVNTIGASWLVPMRLRTILLRAYGVRIGKGSFVYPGCVLGGTDIELGDNTHLNVGCILDNSGHIRIGHNCGLSFGVLLVTGDHEVGPSDDRVGGESSGRAITIGDGCWLGARVTVLPGVTIGQGCVIGAGAVVVDDLAPDGVYIGTPARRIRDLEPAPFAPGD